LAPRYPAESEIRIGNPTYSCYYKCLRDTFNMKDIKSICDVGCATGLVLYEIRKEFPEITLMGLEYFQYHYNVAPIEIQNCIQIADLRDDLKLSRTFDIVNCSEVAEHIDPDYCEQFLKNIDKLFCKYLVMTWSQYKDDPNKAIELHQHFNPQSLENYKKIMTSRGYKMNQKLTEKFIQESFKYQDFSFWWRESLVVWEK